MIRSTLTAHLADADRRGLTLQVNDRDIGVLASQEQRHYVMSGNRRVQLIAGLATDPEDPASVLSTRALLRHWLVSFRELQINGLSRFPLIAERNRLDADFLLLMDAERVTIWTDPPYAVYLHRGHHLYRQQPTYPPGHPSLMAFNRMDFYAFRPREGDDLLIIDPAFIDLFEAQDLEDLLADIHQINVAMTELTRLATSYGRDVDTSWFSAQIQKLEKDLEMFSAESRERFAGRRGSERDPIPWQNQLTLSKVVPLLDGNVRIDPPGYQGQGQGRLAPPAAKKQPKPPQFTSVWQDSQEERRRMPLQGEDRVRRERKPMPDPYQTRGGFLDRVKHWNTDGIKRRLAGWHHRLTHLVPGSRGLSLLTYLAIWLVILVIFVTLFVSVKGKRGQKETEPDRPKVTSPSETETPKTDFEIDIVVKANSLRVLAEPEGEELVGTVTRGDRLVQLTHAEDGWVLVRLLDGRTGYVPEALLLASENGD